MKKSYTNLFYFHKKNPSRDDALNALHNCLSLLSDALPVALGAIGRESPYNQDKFWRSYHILADSANLTVKYCGDELEEIRENVEVRLFGERRDDLDAEAPKE